MLRTYPWRSEGIDRMQAHTNSINEAARNGHLNHHSFLGMTAVIRSAPMRQLMHVVEKIAKSNAAVLIIGETGSGKEVVARALHHYSLRCGRPWIDVNCAALPDHLLESELFGHEKGAFSGADSMKQGTMASPGLRRRRSLASSTTRTTPPRAPG